MNMLNGYSYKHNLSTSLVKLNNFIYVMCSDKSAECKRVVVSASNIGIYKFKGIFSD